MERDFEKGSRGGGSVYNRRRTGSQNGNPGEFHCSSRTALGEMDLELGETRSTWGARWTPRVNQRLARRRGNRTSGRNRNGISPRDRSSGPRLGGSRSDGGGSPGADR